MPEWEPQPEHDDHIIQWVLSILFILGLCVGPFIIGR